MTAVVLKANAKLTVSLRITGVRDDGYHLLDAEMVTLDLADTVTFTEGSGGSGAAALTMSGPFAAGIALDDSNLVTRALRLTGRTAAVHVDKVIPAGGGLGGGSADAAAVLRWAGVSDLALAARLGADVPICMIGGRARVEGIGEILTPLPFEERTYTLVTPPLAVSTIAAYRMWDELGGPRAQGPNDLEPAALAVEPRLAEWRDRIAAAVAAAPVLAGSGSTYFVDGDHLDVLRRACAGANVVVARTAMVEPA